MPVILTLLGWWGLEDRKFQASRGVLLKNKNLNRSGGELSWREFKLELRPAYITRDPFSGEGFSIETQAIPTLNFRKRNLLVI